MCDSKKYTTQNYKKPSKHSHLTHTLPNYLCFLNKHLHHYPLSVPVILITALCNTE